MATTIKASECDDQLNQLAGEISSVAAQTLTHADSREALRRLLRASRCTNAVLAIYGKQPHPLLADLVNIAARVPILVLLRQYRAVKIELRRFLETSLRYVYFLEHPVEFASYEDSPGTGYDTKENSPIAYCSSRSFQWYRRYTIERFSRANLEHVTRALQKIEEQYSHFSRAAHVGPHNDLGKPESTAEPLDAAYVSELAGFAQDSFSSSLTIILSIGDINRDALDAEQMAHLKWLLGGEQAKRFEGDPRFEGIVRHRHFPSAI